MGTAGGWSRHWIVRSLMVGAISSLLDLTALLVTHGVGLSTPLCAACGVSLGAAANFSLNRRFAFRAGSAPLLPALVRFAAGTALLVAIHAICVGLMVDRMQVPLLLAKYSSDATILFGGNLLLLRYVVFARALG